MLGDFYIPHFSNDERRTKNNLGVNFCDLNFYGTI